MENRDFFPIDTVFDAVPRKYFSLIYIFYQLKFLDLENRNTDGAVPGINRAKAHRLAIVKPPQAIVEAYSNYATHIQNKIETSNKENEKLAAIRDYLLPKLISGDIRVSNAEKFTEA